MSHFNWRVAVLAMATGCVFTAYAVAQESSSGRQGKSRSSQSSSSDNSSQGQSQASKDDAKSSTNAERDRDNASATRDSKGSQDQSKQDQSSSRSRDDRDSARSDRDDRASSRDRSSRDYDRDADRNRDRDDRNADNRSARSDRDSSRERSTRRDNMRGPDIGIWFSRPSRDGLVISDVASKGAIAKLGFREGDRIVSVNGHRVTREDEFIDFLFRSDVRRVTVIVLRNNREETIYVEPAVLLDERDYVEVDPLERFGIIVDDRYDDRIVVWRVIPRSPAYYAGFRPGDVIVKFGDRPFRTRTEFERGARDWKAGDVSVQIRRGDRTRDLSAEIPRADDRRGDRAERRDERTAQRESINTDQGGTNRSDRNINEQRNDNRRGILRGRGSR